MDPRNGLKLGGLGLGYVLVSSWFGLNGRFMLQNLSLEGTGSFFIDVWTDTFLASATFLSGTLLAGFLAWRLALSRGPLLSAIAGFGANWLVYAASFLLLDEQGGSTPVFEAVTFVLDVGIIGLALATVLPLVAARAIALQDPFPTVVVETVEENNGP